MRKVAKLSLRVAFGIALSFGSLWAFVHRPTVAAEQAAPEGFLKARSQAKANLSTAPGRAYDRKLAEHFNHSNSSLMPSCFRETKNPDTRSFEMVFILSEKGSAQDILIWPETNIAACYRDKLRATSFPIPPNDNYHAYSEMRFGP